MNVFSLGRSRANAQLQNSHETLKCERRKGDIARSRARSLSAIDKSIREERETLKEISASSGYCREARAGAGGVCPPSDHGDRLDTGGRILSSKKEFNHKIRDLGSFKDPDIWSVTGSERSATGRRTLVSDAAGKRNIAGRTERSWGLEINPLCKRAPCAPRGGKTPNGGRRKGDADGQLCEGDIIKQQRGKSKFMGNKPYSPPIPVHAPKPDPEENPRVRIQSRAKPETSASLIGEIGDKVTSGGRQHQETEGDESRLPRVSTRKLTLHEKKPTKLDGTPQITTSAWQEEKCTVRTDLEKPGKGPVRAAPYGESNFNARTQRPPFTASPKPRVGSAPFVVHKSQVRGADLSGNDNKKVKIHASLSKRERRRILQALVSGCNVPLDRSVLERERQRLLRERISAFVASLMDPSDNNRGDAFRGD